MNTNQISKRVNVIVTAVSITLICLAIVAFIGSYTIAGSLLFVSGVLLFVLRGKQEIYIPTGSKIKRETYYFDRELISRVENIVKGGFAEDTAVLPLIQNGGGKMETIITADKEFIAVQLFRFVPHKFEATTEQIYYTGIKAKKLIECIEKSPVHRV